MNYKVLPSIVPDDLYEKARLDIINAMDSVRKLTDIQRKALAEELFGVAYVEMLIKIINGFTR